MQNFLSIFISAEKGRLAAIIDEAKNGHVRRSSDPSFGSWCIKQSMCAFPMFTILQNVSLLPC